MTELSDAHPTLSDEKSSFTLSDAQPELCVVTLSHCDSLSTCARLLLANQHWRGISAQDSTWRALCKVVARDALLVFEPDQLLSTHGSYRAAARWLHGLRHTFKRPVDGEAAAHVEPKFSIKVGVRFRPHGTAAEQPAEAASAEQPVSSDRVVLPLHQRLQLLQQAHDCSASEARRRLWASAANSDPWASAACADKENNAVAEPPQPAAAAKGEEEAARDDDAAAAAAPGVAANAAGLLSLQPHAPGAPGAVTLVCPAPKGIRHFGFDYAHAADASQAEVYAAAAPLVTDLLNGRSGCVLAYGQTGSGKTHTMWGSAADAGALDAAAAGVAPRVLNALVRALRARRAAGLRVRLEMACVEVYGHEVSDLLQQRAAVGAWGGVAARAVAEGRANVLVTAEGAPCEEAELEQAASLLRKAAAAKRTAATAMNERSSRAHTLLLLTLVQQRARGGARRAGGGGRAPAPAPAGGAADEEAEEAEVRSCLTLADLGGCELLKKSKAQGERLQEAVQINLGLLALKNVITALHQGHSYVPYQDDRLTTALQPSLGGRGTTLVLVTGRPEGEHVTETCQAMRFGEVCAQVEVEARGDTGTTAAAALRALDAEIEKVQAQIVQKERWETRVVRRRDERAGQAAHGAGGAAYLTDNVDEEYKVSGLVGAEAEHKRMDQLVQIRRKLLGEIE